MARRDLCGESIDLGPLSTTDGIKTTVDGVTTTDNGELLEDIPLQKLQKYERSRIKCDCKKQAKLIWSRKRQRCFFVCRENTCKYVRRFIDVWDEYLLQEDDIMFIYG